MSAPLYFWSYPPKREAIDSGFTNCPDESALARITPLIANPDNPGLRGFPRVATLPLAIDFFAMPDC